jgi:hypothetical protein
MEDITAVVSSTALCITARSGVVCARAPFERGRLSDVGWPADQGRTDTAPEAACPCGFPKQLHAHHTMSN